MPNFNDLFKDKKIQFQAIIALLVLLLGFALSLAGFVELQTIASERLYLQLQHQTDVQQQQIQTNIDISLDSLTAIAALYQASGDVSRQQLSDYVSSDTKYHSGTVALGWVPKVLAADLDAFEHSVQQNNSNYKVYEITGHGMPTSVHGSEASYPIKFIISPNNKQMKAGLNLASIASRYRLMKKAQRQQNTVISQRISLYAGSRQFYGFQALHPVFEAIDYGQSELAGFVLANYDISALIEDVFLVDDPYRDIALYDANTSSQQLLYSSTTKLASVDDVRNRSGKSWTYIVDVADKKWLMVVFPNSDGLSNTGAWLPYAGLIIGGLISLLLTLYLFISLIRSRQLAQLATDLAGTETRLDRQTKLKQQADKASQAKSGLLTAASHDLRQPLHTISLLATLLKTSDSKQEQNTLSNKILLAVEGMNDLFSSLLDISLLESNQLIVNKQHFYVQDILDKLSLEFELQAEQKSLGFSCIDSSICLHSDPILVERILRNLLSNSLRYTVTGKILLGCRRLENYLRIGVYDTGIGLSDEAKDKVFDSFYRDGQAKQLSCQGLGLGLSIVDETAKLLGVNLDLQSQHGRGSVFYIDVPYGKASSIGESQLMVTETALDKNIWIIEDDQITRDSLQQIVKSWQCQVKTMASNKELQQLLAQGAASPDLIMADYQLVNETGLELVADIRTHFKLVIPTIIITATTELSVQKRIEQANCLTLIKPIQVTELNHLIKVLS